jgi:hypothetical protein
MPIWSYSAICQPVTMLSPNLPCEMLSIVTAIRAAKAGGTVSTATDANSWMRLVIAARPAIRVKDSRLWSQYSVLPPKPCSLIIESAKLRLYRSALRTISAFKSKLDMYCGEFVDTSQPLLPMGMKTPTSIFSSSLVGVQRGKQ